MKTMPTAEYTLRSRPWHSGQTVSESSLKLCTTSIWEPHSVHAYWYVGTGSSYWHSHPSTAKYYAVRQHSRDIGGAAPSRSPAITLPSCSNAAGPAGVPPVQGGRVRRQAAGSRRIPPLGVTTPSTGRSCGSAGTDSTSSVS
ncbi:hypothetical protein GCM10023224_42080 [Streptomonospora halophila]|uniref:Uncharacterized protein n=1 Tax=Streptomonospora halophila TaxID=427369 RepID=A0ABP9GTM4_9ACTN